MSITIFFTNTSNRLPKPAPLPEVKSTKAEADAFFSGMWHGLAIGCVIGAGVIVALFRS